MAMSYAEAVAALSGLAQSAPSLSLARMEALCARLGSPEQRFRSVLVGGSAGKGSTTAFLAAILHAAGRRVGSAPKPHLWSHCERVQVNGEPIGVADFAAVLERVLAVAPEVTRTVGPVTVFEALTTVAFLHFAESGVEQAVIEVGLGGRYDATNVLPAELAVITMIGLDHTDRLGTTHAAIAGEKAGILRAGRPVVTGATGDGLAVIEARAARLGCPVWRLGREIQLTDVRPDRPGVEFSFRSPLGSLPGLFASLTGGHQARNAALAVSAAQLLAQAEAEGNREAASRRPLDESAIRRGLRETCLPGRLQRVQPQPEVLVDGAHSPDRVDALIEALETVFQPAGRRLVLVLGCSTGHDPAEIARRLCPRAAVTVVTQSRHPAAVPARELAAAAQPCCPVVRSVETVSDAIQTALAAADPQDLVLVTGSLFVVGEALEALNRRAIPAVC